MSLHDYHRIQQRLGAVANPVGFLINLFAHAPVGFAVWSADGKPLLTNKAFIDIFLAEPPPEYNVLKDELLAKSGMLTLFERAFRGETVHVPTFWYDPREHTAITIKEGRRVAISMTIFPLLAASGEIEYVAATYKDETAVTLANDREAELQRSAQRAVERSEGRKIAVLEAALDAIVSIDHDGSITDFNPAAERMFGYPRSDALGKPIVDLLIPPSLRARHRQGFSRYLETGVGPILGKRIETRAMRANGTEFPVELAVVPTRVQDMLFFTGYIRDISARVEAARALQESEQAGARALAVAEKESVDRERAEVALRETEEQLRQSQKMEAIGTLAGSIAHDFNNILSIVLGYTETVLEDLKADDPVRADVQQIATAGGRARDLTRQLLAFSRQQVLQPKLLNLNEAFSAMMQMLKRLVGEDIELSFLPGPDLGAVRVDPSQIEQVLLNLVVNARDAMPAGGKLTVETSDVELDEDYAHSHYGIEPGSYVLLAVSDTGIGMDSATRARIFEPFFTTKEKGKGTGLGLSTVFGIVKQSGGTLWVYSEPGHGTTFKVYLPRLGAAPSSLRQKVPPAVSIRGSETVLLVEDDAQVRALVSTVLRKNGYRVLEAGNGKEALSIAEQHGGVIDVLLSDVVMPGMGGRQLWERLAPRRPKMKVLFMSGYTNDAIVHHGVQKSQLAFIQKPMVPRALLLKLRQVLASSSVSRPLR